MSKFSCSDNSFNLGSTRSMNVKDRILNIRFESGFNLELELTDDVIEQLINLLLRER